MRLRIESQKRKGNSALYTIKYALGGLWDIDFILQAGILSLWSQGKGFEPDYELKLLQHEGFLAAEEISFLEQHLKYLKHLEFYLRIYWGKNTDCPWDSFSEKASKYMGCASLEDFISAHQKSAIHQLTIH